MLGTFFFPLGRQARDHRPAWFAKQAGGPLRCKDARCIHRRPDRHGDGEVVSRPLVRR